VAKHEGFSLVAVVDPDPSRRQEATEKYGGTGHSDLGEALASHPLDLVVIASPTVFHVDQAVGAFENAVDVFCDKPLAPNLTEAQRVVEQAKRHGRKLMVYQPHRGRPETVAAQDILARGILGRVFMIKRASSGYDARNDWQAFTRNGGGMLNNYGAHYIDQLLYLAESSVSSLFATLDRILSMGDADDVVKVVIRTQNGITLDLDINMAAAIPFPPFQILGDRGSMTLDTEAGVWRVKYRRDNPWDDVEVHEELAAPGRKYGTGTPIDWIEETVSLSDVDGVDYYQQCYEYYALDREPFVPIAQTMKVMEAIEQCRRQVQPVDKNGEG